MVSLGKTVRSWIDGIRAKVLSLIPPARWRRQIEQQQSLIRALQEEVDHLNLTLEARVLERTEDLRVKARRMALVEQAGRRLASILDPEALLQEAGRTLRQEFGYFTAAIYLLEETNLKLAVLATGDEKVQQRAGQSLYIPLHRLEELQRFGRPIAHADLLAGSHPVGLPRLGRGRASLSVPMIASDRLLGVLDLQSPLRQHFDESDALILHTLATQLAITLERSHLYRQEQIARQRTDALAVLARVVTTSLDLDRILSLGLDQLRRILPYDAATVLLLEEGELVPAASSELSLEAIQELQALFSSEHRRGLTRLLERGEPLLATVLEGTGETIPSSLSPYSSWLAVPLTSRGAVVGAVFVTSREPDFYKRSDLRAAEDFAGQVSTAIENARLYSRVRQDRDRLGTLYEIAQQLNADLQGEDPLRQILELAKTSVGGIAGSVILLDPSGRPTHSILSRPHPSSEDILRQVLAQGAAGWAWREQRGLLIRDSQKDPRWYMLSDDPWHTRSAVVVPLIGQGQVIGILTVVHHQVGHFGQDDLDLLTSIAGQASTVVQRASLFATIREERARLEAVIEGTADAVIVLDGEGRVLHVNRSAAQQFELEGSVMGASLTQVLPNPALQTLLDQSRGLSTGAQVEMPLIDGKTLDVLLTPIPDVGAVITMHDISSLKEIDRMKSDFVATVSHDLRTPLGAVQGFVEALELAGPLNADQCSFVNRILQTVESMTGLVGDLLDLAKIEAGVEMDMAPCQVAAVIGEVADQMNALAATREVDLQIRVPEDLPLVWGNGRRLGQVVGNFLDNAIKYSPAGGRVVLRAYVEAEDICVEVTDEGPGIPPASLPHIFEKFYHRDIQCGSQKPGTGLGLSIARSIVQAHGGRIWAKSKEGEGSTFSFSVPRWQGSRGDRPVLPL